METDTELLQVVDSFQISGLGLIVVPDFSVPESGWTGRLLPARVVRPDGSEVSTFLSLQVSHFNIPDPAVPLDRRWRVVPIFPHLTKDEVPVGSCVLVDSDAVNALGGAMD